MRVLTADQMREADRRTIEEIGLPSIALMENAGHQVVSALHVAVDEMPTRRVCILCGRGNNGGDGLVVARLLWEQGIDVQVILLSLGGDLTPDAEINCRVARNLGVPVVDVADEEGWDSARATVAECDLLVDAVFGTGLNKPIAGLLETVVAEVNELGAEVVAIDLPSGLAADQPTVVGETVAADLTITLAAPKVALLVPPAEAWAGELVIADIGIPNSVVETLPGDRLELLTPEEVGRLIAPRAPDAHKGHFGHVLVVAGSVGKSGAARLAGLGALRSGAGLVTVATPRSCVSEVTAATPEYMTLPLPETDDGAVAADALDALLEFSCDVMAVGPGLGTGSDTASLVQALVERTTVPLVLDADALNIFAADPHALRGRDGIPLIITPHPGEMARLCQTDVASVQSDRLGIARRVAVEHQVFVVLKGAGSVIAAPDGTAWLNLTGNAGMATGGVGDVLTGVIATWLAQCGRPDVACQVGVFLHGLAGDLAAEEHGEVALTASDLVGYLGQAVREAAKQAETMAESE